jgi:hypothetical protein
VRDVEMALQRSLISEYISVILQAIDTIEKDPAQLRGLVYDLARLRLGEQSVTSYSQIGNVELLQHLLMLEIAINRVEILSRLETEVVARLENDEHAFHPPTQSVDSSDQAPTVSRELSNDAAREHVQNGRALVVNQLLGDVYRETYPIPGFLTAAQTWRPNQAQEPIQSWEAVRTWEPAQTFGLSSKWIRRKIRSILPFVAATCVALVVLAVTLALFDYANVSVLLRRPSALQGLASVPPASQATPPGTGNASISNLVARPTGPGYQLPAVYGIYAVSDGQPIELKSLPISVPDPRIAISAVISTPSVTTIRTGRIFFVLFRRDLLFSAPDRISIRVVARVAREMKFTANNPAMTAKTDGQWAIRDKSYEFRVAPLSDHPEMLVVRPENIDFALPAGRYALVIKGVGYDFTIAGRITDNVQCLERSESVGGTIYSECRNPL